MASRAYRYHQISLQREAEERERWCEKYLSGQPQEIQNFFKAEFVPTYVEDLADYQHMKTQLERGRATVEDHHGTLAQIGYGDMLKYLYESHPGSQGVDVRAKVIENPNCPGNLLVDALKAPEWQLRKAAVANPSLPPVMRQNLADREQDPNVQAALKEWLSLSNPEARYFTRAAAQQARSVSAPGRKLSEAPSIGLPPLEARKLMETPEWQADQKKSLEEIRAEVASEFPAFNPEQKRKPSLQEQMKAAEEKRAALQKDIADLKQGKGTIGQAPEGLGFVPGGR